MADYIPGPDASFQAWQSNFVTYANANLAALGLVAADGRGGPPLRRRGHQRAVCDELRLRRRGQDELRVDALGQPDRRTRAVERAGPGHDRRVIDAEKPNDSQRPRAMAKRVSWPHQLLPKSPALISTCRSGLTYLRSAAFT